MKVITPGSARFFLAPLGEWVEGEIEVDDTLGAQLVAQGWDVPKPAVKKAATKSEED